MTTEELKAFREEKLSGFVAKWFSNIKTRSLPMTMRSRTSWSLPSWTC